MWVSGDRVEFPSEFRVPVVARFVDFGVAAAGLDLLQSR